MATISGNAIRAITCGSFTFLYFKILHPFVMRLECQRDNPSNYGAFYNRKGQFYWFTDFLKYARHFSSLFTPILQSGIIFAFRNRLLQRSALYPDDELSSYQF